MRLLGWMLLTVSIGVGACTPSDRNRSTPSAGTASISGTEGDFQRAVGAYHSQRYRECETLCQSILDRRPYYMDAELLLARAYRDDKLWRSAVIHYERVLDLVPTHREARIELAEVQADHGQGAASLETSRVAVQYDPEDIDALLAQARAHQSRGEHSEALECIEQAIRISPKQAEPHIARIQYYLDEGRPDLARTAADEAHAAGAPEKTLARAEKRIPKSAAVEKGTSDLRSTPPETPPAPAPTEAAPDAVAAPASETPAPPAPPPAPVVIEPAAPPPSNAAAFEEMGNGFLAQGKPIQAVAAFEEALERQPTNPELQRKLVTAFQAIGDDSKIIEYFTGRIRKYPYDAESHTILAETYLRGGQLAPARAHGETAVLLAPKTARMHALLGAVCAKTGDRKSAAAAFRRALDIEPANAEYQKNLKEVDDSPAAPPPPVKESD